MKPKLQKRKELTNLPEPPPPPEAIADRQIEEYTQGANFTWVTSTLMAYRDEILARWLDSASKQQFHAGRRERAVADHIPHLFDALVDLLNSTTPAWVEAQAPLEDIGILTAAQSHARIRAEQGLSPANIVVEFRLLRQEIWRALRSSIPDRAPTEDVVAAEMLINDALDGAISQGLAALSDHVEQVREEFLATTMHDVGQPLTVISGEAQMLVRILAQDQPKLERVRAAGERIQASVKRMSSMLETLTDMSRLALGSLELRLHLVSLEDVVRHALPHCGTDAVERVAIHVNAPAGLTGTWDANRLEQVICNLVGNAVKYSPAGTPIELSLFSDEVSVRLSVRDHGIGIPAADIEHIFSRYVRAGNALEGGIDGLGLGLYLCRGIIEAHGGRIWAESPGRDQGTTLTFELPRSQSYRGTQEDS